MVWTRLTRLGIRSTFVYAAGRFNWVRRGRRMLRAQRDHGRVQDATGQHVQMPDHGLKQTLRDKGYTTGLALTQGSKEALLGALQCAEVKPLGSGIPNLRELDAIDAFNQGALHPICLSRVDSIDVARIAHSIAHDRDLLNVVRTQLGGGISRVEPLVMWSHVVDATDEWRESQAQTVTFHFDVHSLDFVYVFFYLTDCDRGSGAHELIERSHTDKPWRFLLGSARRAEGELRSHYDASTFRVIEGEAGTGFIEDTSCFHRARAPVEKPRLTLQIRYS